MKDIIKHIEDLHYPEVVKMYKTHLGNILPKGSDVDLEWSKVLDHVSKTIKRFNLNGSIEVAEQIISDYFVVFHSGMNHGMDRAMLAVGIK